MEYIKTYAFISHKLCFYLCFKFIQTLAAFWLVFFWKPHKAKPLHKKFTTYLHLSDYGYGSVMTPYYSEETVFSRNDLDMENEDGVSIIFYLQKIFPGKIFHFTPLAPHNPKHTQKKEIKNDVSFSGLENIICALKYKRTSYVPFGIHEKYHVFPFNT